MTGGMGAHWVTPVLSGFPVEGERKRRGALWLGAPSELSGREERQSSKGRDCCFQMKWERMPGG